MGDPGPGRGDKLDGDRLGAGVARESLPVGHRVLVASGHVDHQLGGVGRRKQGEEKDEQAEHRDTSHNAISLVTTWKSFDAQVEQRPTVLECHILVLYYDLK